MLKRKLFSFIFFVSMSILFTTVTAPLSAHASEHNHDDLEAVSEVNEDIPLSPIVTESDVILDNLQPQPRAGYRWTCPVCHYVSNWHAFKDTAMQNLIDHSHKYGHSGGHVFYVY